MPVHVEFFEGEKQDQAKTREAGRPIYESVDMVRIRFPGDSKRVHVAYANEKSLRSPETGQWLTYVERFPEHWALYRQDAEQMVGTPLKELPFLNAGQRATLEAKAIRTAEALAGLSDRIIAEMGMGTRSMVEQARAYLEHANDTALETRLAAENAEMSERMEAMQRELEELKRLNAEPAPKRRGRPPKVRPEADAA